MPDIPLYKIVWQQPAVYLDGGIPTQGFLVRAKLLAFNEVVEVNVTTLDPDTVNELILERLENRIKLDKLGTIETE
jgi:hypothetical protein